MTTNMLAIGLVKRETLSQFCARTGREFFPMGTGNVRKRMMNVNAWYEENDTKGLIING